MNEELNMEIRLMRILIVVLAIGFITLLLNFIGCSTPKSVSYSPDTLSKQPAQEKPLTTVESLQLTK